MDWFKNKEKNNIYILSGVEDYLTESAKKYKRNLMYCIFLIITLSLFKHLDLVKSFKSILGFSINEDEGIPVDLVIALISGVCVYEFSMLITYKKTCDSHWFGKRLSDTKAKGDDAEVVYFKEIIKNIVYDFKEVESIINSVNAYELDYKDLVDKRYLTDWDKTIDSFCQDINDDIQKTIDAISERPDLILNEDGEIKVEVRERTDERILIILERLESRLNEEHERRLGTANTIKKLIINNNEEWKVYIEHQIQKNISTYTELANKIDEVSRPHKRIVYGELYVPLFLGFVAIFIGGWQAYHYIKSLPV
ncbi:hypothetical protein J7X65_000995 [Vibrio parahaemolyticus]|nr:hypothetical protein [Vibrio parahaemolyticus]